MNSSVGLVTNIQRWSLHDGPGTRTVVFLKGCPLRCAWCANPETQSLRQELAYFNQHCIHCRICLGKCPGKALTWDENAGCLGIRRNQCTTCGECVKSCPSGALRMIGTAYSAAAVLEIVRADRVFYDTSDGGLTLSGGEPLLQKEFCRDILEVASSEGIDTAVETCGEAPEDDFKWLFPYVNHWLFDFKHFDPLCHQTGTDGDNARILRNAQFLVQACQKNPNHADFRARMPVIPSFNDTLSNLAQAAKFFLANGIAAIDLMPYHSYGFAKYLSMDIHCRWPEADSAQAKNACNKVAAYFHAAGLSVTIQR